MHGTIKYTATVKGRPVEIDATFSMVKGEVTIHRATDDTGRSVHLTEAKKKTLEGIILSDYES